MTLEDVRVQAEALMRDLEEQKGVSMITILCEGNKGDMMSVGNTGDLLMTLAIGLGRYMPDHGLDRKAVKAFCDLLTNTAKERMKTAGKVN